jgi:hypothetical protein
MEEGVIHGDRYALKWIEKSRDKGAIVSMFQKGIKLTNPCVSNNGIETCYCSNCNKMIIDVNDKVN